MMKSLLLVRAIVLIFVILACSSIYLVTTSDLENRIDNILSQHSYRLNNSYKVTQDKHKTISDGVYSTIINQKPVLDLIYKAVHATNDKDLSLYRNRLYDNLIEHYENLEELGVVNIMFAFENNKVLLRINNPKICNDDISRTRYSVAYVNKTKKPIRGFEEGEVSHAFRNIYPLYYKGDYLGNVDISFSSDSIEKNMIEVHQTETHFILNKRAFNINILNTEYKQNYKQSVEHEDFLFSIGGYRKSYHFHDSEIEFAKNYKDEIYENIKNGNQFSIHNNKMVVVFLPIKNIQDNETVAYLVSYNDSYYLNATISEYILVNTVGFLVILIIALIVYSNLKQRLFLEIEVEKKTKDLKYLNEHLELEVRKQSEAFQTIFEKASNGTMIIEDGSITECNEAIIKIFNMETKDGLINKSFVDISPKYQADGSDSKSLSEDMITLSLDEGVNNFEWIFVRNGLDFWADVTITPISLLDKDIIHVVIRDISYQKHIQQELINQKMMLHHRATHDSLTKLPNRELFNDRLSQIIKTCKRQKKKFAVLFIDLDRFKQINDSLGHLVGDQVLQEISDRFQSVIRNEDTLARLGGDEFSLLQQELNNADDAAILAEKIIDVATKPIFIDGHELYVSASVGISLYPEHSVDGNDLLMFADNAMYKAKDVGRNNFQFYKAEMTTVALSRVVMESNMRKALENNEFIVYYQPQINGKTGQLIGMEALIRWEHPTMGLIQPEKFISIAEDTGLIVDLDKWVVKTTVKQFSQWYKKGLKPGVLAVNLAVKLLQHKDFIGMVKRVLDEYDYKPELLEFEVTESQIMTDPINSIMKLKELGNMNIEIAIDDFGTGYSSLSQLKNLPIDKLKIDRSFIRDIPIDENDMHIIKAVIALADSLNLNVLAEGVESQEQLEFLIENGCENIQGYFFSKPMPADEVEKFLNEKISS